MHFNKYVNSGHLMVAVKITKLGSIKPDSSLERRVPDQLVMSAISMGAGD